MTALDIVNSYVKINKKKIPEIKKTNLDSKKVLLEEKYKLKMEKNIVKDLNETPRFDMEPIKLDEEWKFEKRKKSDDQWSVKSEISLD